MFREGLRGVFSHGFRSFASITVIAACLLIMGSFALVGINIDSIIRDMERESQILAVVELHLILDGEVVVLPDFMVVALVDIINVVIEG